MKFMVNCYSGNKKKKKTNTGGHCNIPGKDDGSFTKERGSIGEI